MRLEPGLLEAYNNTRSSASKELICHAPFANINFDQDGRATACCYNRNYVLGSFPQDSIREIWFGKKADGLRELIAQNDLSGGCQICLKLLRSRNFRNTRARFYDDVAVNLSDFRSENSIPFPRMMEFELTNACNLECVMCNGDFSSRIRKNREHAPPKVNCYDGKFLEQLKEFVPHLSDAKFLGGEPFLIDIYYQIWDMMVELNKDILIHITTNGTVLNSRVLNVLDRLNCGIIVSVDSLQKETFEKIRMPARFESVMNHLEKFRSYARSKNTYIGLAVCPITENWKEIPDMVRFCNQNGMTIVFNTVFKPREYTLRRFTRSMLEEIHAFYDSQNFSGASSFDVSNLRTFEDLKHQIQAWIDDKIMMEEKARKLREMIDPSQSEESEDRSDASCKQKMLSIFDLISGQSQDPAMSDNFPMDPIFYDYDYDYLDLCKEVRILRCQRLVSYYGADCFIRSYCEVLSDHCDPVLQDGLRQLGTLVLGHKEKERIAADLALANPVSILQNLKNRGLLRIRELIQEKYSPS